MNVALLNKMLDAAVQGDDLGHWKTLPYLLDKPPVMAFGFLYVIRNRISGKLYIGKKQTKHGGKKTSRTYGKEMPWRTYESSSAHVKKDLKDLGKSNFDFVIVEHYATRGGLNYSEVEYQVKCDVLTERLDEEERLFYNAQISAVRWIPKEYTTHEQRLNNLKEIK